MDWTKKTVLVAVAALALCGVKTASATFLYDFSDANAHIEFTVPTILTSLTTETTFLFATFTGGKTITAFTVDPVPVGNCPLGLAGPCVDYVVALGGVSTLTVEYSGFPTFTSVGTFTPGGGITIRISQVVPEPATLALLAVGLAGLGFSRRRNSN